jgi:hypothetical protein
VEQSVAPETSAQDEVSTPSIPTQGVTNP